MDRLVFVQSPFDLANVATAADSIKAEMIVLDYIQRIRPTGEFDDNRGSINATMESIRQFADVGCCVLVMSAVGRSKDSRGRSSYAGNTLSLASFRESSELEYGADDAYLLVAANDEESSGGNVAVTLKQLKCRYGQPIDLDLMFDREFQSFSPHEFVAGSQERLHRSLQGLYEVPA